MRAPNGSTVDGVAVAFDSRNDIAVLRVPPGSLGTTPLQMVDPQEGAEVAIVGYPENRVSLLRLRASGRQRSS